MRTSALGLLVGAGLLLAACSDGTGPVVQPQFSRQITFDEFEEILTGGAARAEIEIVPLSLSGGGLPIAAEVELKGPDEMDDEERIESPVTGLDESMGTLTLKLGEIKVEFTATTEFEDESGDELTLDEFVNRVRAALADEPAVEVERDPLTPPQDPDEGTFVAAKIELDDEADEPELELNIDPDNLIPCSASSPAGCLGVLKVLNVEIVLLKDETELEAEVPDLAGEVDFEGVVEDVEREGTSCRLGTVTLMDGTIIKLVEGTEIEHQSGDDDQLDDLCEVEEALAGDGLVIVEADGEGVVDPGPPLTIVAIEIEFEVEERAEDVAGKVDFEGVVEGVERAGESCRLGTVTLEDGTVVRLALGTEIEDGSGDADQLGDLCAVEQALGEAGVVVEADGEGVLEELSPPRILATKVNFETRD